jgi:hypothetical protein
LYSEISGIVCVIDEKVYSQRTKCLPADIIRSMQNAKCAGVVILTEKPFSEHFNQGNSVTVVIPTVLVSSDVGPILANSTNSTLRFLPIPQEGNNSWLWLIIAALEGYNQYRFVYKSYRIFTCLMFGLIGLICILYEIWRIFLRVRNNLGSNMFILDVVLIFVLLASVGRNYFFGNFDLERCLLAGLDPQGFEGVIPIVARVIFDRFGDMAFITVYSLLASLWLQTIVHGKIVTKRILITAIVINIVAYCTTVPTTGVGFAVGNLDVQLVGDIFLIICILCLVVMLWVIVICFSFLGGRNCSLCKIVANSKIFIKQNSAS